MKILMPPVSKYWIVTQSNHWSFFLQEKDSLLLLKGVFGSLQEAMIEQEKQEMFFHGNSMEPLPPPEKTTLTIINEEI